VESREVAETLKTDLFGGSVVVHTPQGKAIDLPEGSTPIDFAYRIHSEVGERCVAAKLNGRITQLTTPLKSGQTVEIVTSKKAHPSRDWLDHVKTHKARVRIRHWLKQENYEDNVEAGRASIVQACKAAELGIPVNDLEKTLEPIVQASGKFSSVESLFAAVGFGSFKASAVVDRIKQSRARQQRKKRVSPVAKPESNVLVEGNEGMVARLAQCCRPVEGEDIVGFVRRGQGVVVHRKTCKTLGHLVKNPGARQKLVMCDWRPGTPSRNRACMRIMARDRPGLLADVSQILKEEAIFIVDYGLANRDADHVTLRFDVATRESEALQPVLKRLRGAESVLDVAVT
jgi:GTP pyrophosphokinase